MDSKITFEKIPEAISLLITEVRELKLELGSIRDSYMEPDLLTVNEAAKYLDLAVGTIYSMVSRGEIPVNKKRGRLYFLRSELTEWIKSGRRKTTAEIRVDAMNSLKILKRRGTR